MQEALVKDQITFHQPLERLVDAVMEAGCDVLFLCSLVAVWNVLAAVSTEDMFSCPVLTGELPLLPIEFFSFGVVEPNVLVGSDQALHQGCGLVSELVEVLFLQSEEAGVK